MTIGTTQHKELNKEEKIELSRILKNTKRMEDDFVNQNLDLNKNKMTFCVDKEGNETTFISSKTQLQVLNKIFATTTRSVTENDKYDVTRDSQISRAKRIYSRKKENIKLLTTLFNNGGHMVRYFKYVTCSGNVSSKDVTPQRIRSFIDRLRNAYNDAEVIEKDGKRYLLTPIEFRETMVKLDIYKDIDHLCEDFQ